MGATLNEALAEAGVDVDGVMERFLGKQELMEKFLFRFVNDQTYSKVIEGMENHDADAMFKAAHALKGLSGNLGLTPVYEPLCELCDAMRHDGFDGPYEEPYEKMKVQYEKLVDVIKAYIPEGYSE
ncbi:MAG: Hpt domain-containing protein [Lachnospiraceae bacterium]|nr:Hpt domain-containing protein [Lachnospiraceae bacterium]